MKLGIILSILFTNMLLSNTFQCTKKQFLLNILGSDTIWVPIKTSSLTRYAPFSEIGTSQGSFFISTPGSDPIMRYLGITYASDGTKKIILQGTKHYKSQIVQQYEKYFDKTLILKPYNNNCNLNNIILEVYMNDSNHFNIKKEIILFRKKMKNEKIDSNLTLELLEFLPT